MLTLFRPATGEVRAKGVPRAPNAVLHPWLQHELLQVLKELPEVSVDAADLPRAAQWATWLGHVPHLPLPPLRLSLVLDNLAGHLSTSIVTWLFAHGVMPLYIPLSGSWLNMAESVQRIICRRALTGQHPQSVVQLITWLEDTVAGWNANPTPSCGVANGESVASEPNSVISVVLLHASSTSSLRRDPLVGHLTGFTPLIHKLESAS